MTRLEWACWTPSLRFLPPPGYALSPSDQGGDDAMDSDVDPVSGATTAFTLGAFDNHTRGDAGMVLTACTPPGEAPFLYVVTLSSDGNDYPILHRMDANQPTQITGYNIYRASDPALLADPSSLFPTDVIDMDEAMLDGQWVDSSGDASPTGI